MNKALPLVKHGLILNPFIHIYRKCLFHRKLSAIIESTESLFFGLYKNKSINYFICITTLSSHLIFYVVILLLIILKPISLICFKLSKVLSILKKFSINTAVLSSYHSIFLLPFILTISLFSTYFPLLDDDIALSLVTPELQNIQSTFLSPLPS